MSDVRHPDSPWTPEREEQLRVMVAGGELSYAEMGAELGFSRNATIGKIFRMGLSSSRPRPKSKRKRRPGPKPGPRPMPEPLFAVPAMAGDVVPPPETPAEPAEGPSAAPVDFMGLTHRTCRWPLWDHTSRVPFHQQLYCGATPVPGHCYCGVHLRRSFVSRGGKDGQSD